jgi:cysteine desulfurase
MIYLDNAASTKPTEKVISIVTETMTQYYANPSSFHRLGTKAHEFLEQKRRQICHKLNLPADWLIFTSSATEANQTVLKCGIKNSNKNRNHIIFSAFEHSSVMQTKVFLEEKGFEVEIFQPDASGWVDPIKLSAKIRETTELVSLIGVHNEMGTIQDIVKIKELIQVANSNTLFHVDGVQWFGKYALPPASQMPDFFTFSGHKLNGPRGVGGILKRPNTPLKPLIHGGGQENRIRSGTENLPAIAGLAQALDDQKEETKINLLPLQNRIYEFALHHPSIKWLGLPPGKNRSPYINLISLKNKKSEVLIHQLEEQEIYISSGSACSEKSGKYQSNWNFLNLPNEYKEGILRISLSFENNIQEIETFLKALDKIT